MTKSLKGLSGRAFTTSTNEEFVSGRQLAGVVQPIQIVQPVDFLGSRGSFLGREARGSADLTLGRTSALEDSGDTFSALPCCLGCGKTGSADHHHTFDNSLGGPDGTLTIPPTIMDEGTLTVSVGGSVNGVIDFTGDSDLITVDLVAGQT